MKPEATSIARATAFNKSNINLFFDKLEQVIDENKLSGASIWNLDETGCSTVPNVSRVIAEKGKKQVGQITSQELGQLMSVCELCLR